MLESSACYGCVNYLVTICLVWSSIFLVVWRLQHRR